MLSTLIRLKQAGLYKLKQAAVLAFALTSTGTLAFPEQCIQSPQRTQSCGHLVYKKVTETGKEAKIFCICLEDFEDIRIPATDEIGIAKQKYAMRKYIAELDISEEVLLQLVR